MRAGDLRHRITLQKPTVTRAANGEESVTWADVATVWAAIWPVNGREYFATDQLQTSITHKVRIWHRRDVNPSWRITYGNRIFAIESVINPEEMGRQLELMCEEHAYDNRS